MCWTNLLEAKVIKKIILFQKCRRKDLIGLLQQTIKWCKILHTGGQVSYYSRTGTLKQRPRSSLTDWHGWGLFVLTSQCRMILPSTIAVLYHLTGAHHWVMGSCIWSVVVKGLLETAGPQVQRNKKMEFWKQCKSPSFIFMLFSFYLCTLKSETYY